MTVSIRIEVTDNLYNQGLTEVAEQAVRLVHMATGRLAHMPTVDIRPLYDGAGEKCGSVEVTA